MATMIPSDIEEFTTEGEKAFFRFLQAVAKPDEKYLCWYLPDINGREPDFLLYSEDVGLIIFEVKDWRMDQIISADSQFFTLSIAGKAEKRQNPLHQARDYFHWVMDIIKKDAVLVSKEPYAHGNVKIPVNCGIVFPNINKYEYAQKGLDKIISTETIFFWDDLHPQSPLCSDVTGHCFLETMKRMFSPRFEFRITGRELEHLKQLIFPVVRIDLPLREASLQQMSNAQRLKLLDHHQESIARQYDGGHRIIAGPSGSGKTLILIHRAALLKLYNPAIQNILFVCYNITLVNYIRRLLSDKQVPLGKNGVEVVHFFQLCSMITGEKIPYEKEDMDYYRMVIQDALDKVAAYPVKHDAILVDEGQDFSDDMFRIVMALLNPKTNHLAIALDDNQNIYERSRSWKDLGIQARGRVHRVTWIYRNTQEIIELAKVLEDKDDSASTAGSPQTQLFPDTFESSHGSEPEIKQFTDYQAIITWTADRISHLHNKEGYPLSEIAIVYTMKCPEDKSEINLPSLLMGALERKGIIHQWISEDYRSKKSYDVTTNSVSISTIHSAKGFDYACVFLIGLDWLEAGKRWTEDQIRKLTYVAVTRARERLFVPYCNRNEIIKILLR
mgnify:CR=1 FL=1